MYGHDMTVVNVIVDVWVQALMSPLTFLGQLSLLSREALLSNFYCLACPIHCRESSLPLLTLCDFFLHSCSVFGFSSHHPATILPLLLCQLCDTRQCQHGGGWKGTIPS